MTLARRMWLASVSLAFIVVAAFAALILAISAQREATAREARSADVTAASLRLEKLVVDMENGLRGLTLDQRTAASSSRTRKPRKALPGRLAALQSLVADDPDQRRRAQQLEERIHDYVDFCEADGRHRQGDPLDRRRPADRRRGQAVRPMRSRACSIRFLAAEDALAADAARDADKRSSLAVIVGAVGIGASAALIILFGVFLARSIGRPVRAVASGATRLAAGEWSLRLPLQGPGEIGELTQAFNEMAERIEQNHAELEAQNTELRESERMKTELVSIVSHELRTPLASVLGFTALLLKRDSIRRSEALPRDRRRAGASACRAARRLSRRPADRARGPRVGGPKGSISLRFWTSRRSSMPNRARSTTVEVDLEERPLSVAATRTDWPRSSVTSSRTRSSTHRTAARSSSQQSGAVTGVRSIVRDEGLGIPEDQQERIFTKFFRGDAGATGITGTGLGLAVSREIVEAHGGSIGFDSDPSTGSTFWVELPEEPGEVSANNVKETPR